MRKSVLALMGFALALPAAVRAEEEADPGTRVTKELIETMREIPKMDHPYKDQMPVTKEVPFEDARRVVRVAQLSGVAEWCGVEWERTLFLPFMQGERARQAWSEEELAYMASLHGLTLEIMARGLQERQGDCPPEKAEQIGRLMSGPPEPVSP